MNESNYMVRSNGLLIFQDPITHKDYPITWVMSEQEGNVLVQNLNAAYQRVLRKEKI